MLSKEVLFAAASLESHQPPSLTPRFRQQGSQSYHTANRPAWTPPQEVDLDDGLFLPTEMLGEAGQAEPAVLTGGLFTIVKNALSDLCEQNGWELTLKDTCVRVRLNHGGAAHVDLPIYAVPEKQYRELEEARALLKGHRVADAEDVLLAEEAYRKLAAGEIMLAHRQQGWIRSDPRKLEDWFNDSVKHHGQQLRRVCRYIKAWRDHTWQRGGPSSIALMACIVTAYEDNPKEYEDNRDDLALLKVASHLAGLFSNRIPNPAVPELYLDEGWDENDLRTGYASAASTLHYSLSTALSGTSSSIQVIARLKAIFGERIPNISDSVRLPAPTPDQLLKATAPLTPTVKPQDKRSYA